jgi:hypothetical protein
MGILVLSAFSTVFGLIAKSFPVVFCQLLTIQFFHVRTVICMGYLQII